MQSYATFDYFTAVKRLILMDIYCPIVYTVESIGMEDLFERANLDEIQYFLSTNQT